MSLKFIVSNVGSTGSDLGGFVKSRAPDKRGYSG